MSKGQAEQAPTGEDESAIRPRLWVGSLLDYTNGVLHGDWLDADREVAALQADIQTIPASSPTATRTGEVAEEAGIFDHENFGDLRIDEQESLDWVTAVARGIRQHGLGFAAWADVVQDIELLDGFTDNYLGHFESLLTYAALFIEDAGYHQLLDDALPDSIRPYVRFDIEGIARDIEANGDLHVLPADDGGVWLFDAQ